MDEREIQHYNAALQILSGSLGEGMNRHNVTEKVDTAIAASGLLANKLNKIYKQEESEQA